MGDRGDEKSVYFMENISEYMEQPQAPERFY